MAFFKNGFPSHHLKCFVYIFYSKPLNYREYEVTDCSLEDNPRMREMIKDMFQTNFEEIYECEVWLGSPKSFKLNKPDWVFMDIKMKTMDGIRASRQIKASFPDAKIIIVTDYSDKMLKAEAESAGVIAYVLKERLLDIFSIIS